MNLLGVNIDHVATIRQARKTYEPDPVCAAAEAQLGGADLITVHLREDRRHIQDRDLRLLRQTVSVELNLEMAVAEQIVGIALEVGPDMVTLVPEKRQEVTTEGGLDVRGQAERVREVVARFHERGIPVSLFINPDRAQIEASRQAGADFVELHTGCYANAGSPGGDLAFAVRRMPSGPHGAAAERERHLAALEAAAVLGRGIGLTVNAGHGLTYNNVTALVQRVDPHELHIGHSIIARAVFVGLRQAVRQMKDVIDRARMFERLDTQGPQRPAGGHGRPSDE
jgi:pyridoxine 5-phosphate synthase